MVFVFNPIAPEIPIEDPYAPPPPPPRDDEEGGTDTDRDIPEPEDTDSDSDVDQMAQSLESETLWVHMIVSGAEAGSALSISTAGVFTSLSHLEQACVHLWEGKPYKKYLKKSQKQLRNVVDNLNAFIHYHRYERSCLAETQKRLVAKPQPNKELQPFAQAAVLNIEGSRGDLDITDIDADSSIDIKEVESIQKTLKSLAKQLKSARKEPTDLYVDAFTKAEPSAIDNGLNTAISQVLELVISLNKKASASRMYGAVSKR